MLELQGLLLAPAPLQLRLHPVPLLGQSTRLDRFSCTQAGPLGTQLTNLQLKPRGVRGRLALGFAARGQLRFGLV